MRVYLFLTVLFLSACGSDENKEDLTDNVNKEGAIETSLSVEHLDNERDILVTKHIIWSKNSLFKTIEKRDTLPSLGEMDAKSEDNDQNVKVKRDYEFYITVK